MHFIHPRPPAGDRQVILYGERKGGEGDHEREWEEWGEESTYNSGGDSDGDSSWREDDEGEEDSTGSSDVDKSELEEKTEEEDAAGRAGVGGAAEGRVSRPSTYRGT